MTMDGYCERYEVWRQRPEAERSAEQDRAYRRYIRTDAAPRMLTWVVVMIFLEGDCQGLVWFWLVPKIVRLIKGGFGW